MQIIEFAINDEKNTTAVNTSKTDRQKIPTLGFEHKYMLVSIRSGELSNDHYPIYEFLIKKDKIIKKQKYFYDAAGIEGMEYSILAPIAEMFILILSLALFGIYKLIISACQ
jgi:hypothetical protein